MTLRSKPEGLIRPQAGGERSVTPAEGRIVPKARMGDRINHENHECTRKPFPLTLKL